MLRAKLRWQDGGLEVEFAAAGVELKFMLIPGI